MKSFRDVITDPPANLAEWDTTIRTDHQLVNYWPKQLRRMHRSHAAKVPVAEKELQDRIDFPGKFLFELSEQGITGAEADAELVSQVAYWTWKSAKLRTIVKCCRVETEIREALVVAGRDKPEPDDGKEAEADLPAETKTITSVDGSITRDPVGYNHK